ncbi:hypothetical protein M9H77_07568 [Catharanthus roseus]|uniref:Uncharacterized protein n=1 Tax=Catharanthus roseus TaxID=4058 RepID=A0ACC0BVQ0_CATRO|nr:hypothetical protein M9H77_07568 [Catharanthus roseus]
MVKLKNANVGRDGHGEESRSSRGGKKGKGKQVARSETPSDKFILVKAVANYKDWTKKKGKSLPDTEGRIQTGGNVVTSRVNEKNIAFHDRLLNSTIETPEDGMLFYTKNKKCFDPNLYNEKRSEDKTVDRLDAYGKILHHIISNIIIPNVGHKSSITNMHSFVILALHEHRKMNFGYTAIEHMLATQSSSTKCFPYGCFLAKVFQHFKITFFGPNDNIGISKIYNQNTFKRMGFSRNEDGKLIRGGQKEDSENSEKYEEEEGNEPENVDEEESDSETEQERFRRETRKKKRQERTEEGSSSGSMTQLMEMIASLQTSMNTWFDALDDKISDIQERVMRLEARDRDEGH